MPKQDGALLLALDNQFDRHDKGQRGITVQIYFVIIMITRMYRDGSDKYHNLMNWQEFLILSCPRITWFDLNNVLRFLLFSTEEGVSEVFEVLS